MYPFVVRIKPLQFHTTLMIAKVSADACLSNAVVTKPKEGEIGEMKK